MVEALFTLPNGSWSGPCHAQGSHGSVRRTSCLQRINSQPDTPLEQHQQQSSSFSHKPATFPQQLEQQSQQQSKQQPTSGGRLERFFLAWARLTDSKWIHSVIRDGFRIHFQSRPPLSRTPIPTVPYNVEQRRLLRQVIADLLHKRAIEPVQGSEYPSFFSRMFLFPKKSGGFRSVFNLRSLNQFVECPHFKMENIQQVIKLINRDDFFTSVDLSDAFLHILIHKQFRKYPRFRWEGHTFQFRTTPFGLSVVPWLFTRLTKPILQ